MSKKERGLGRGLEALLSNDMDFNSESMPTEIESEHIYPRRGQPRKSFNEQSLLELAESIREHGVLQPILIRPIGDKYEIVAGERRWRAAQMLKMNKIPVVIKEIDDQKAEEIALIENLQRDDLSIVEEAMAYKRMIAKYGYTQEYIAGKIGKSRAHVTNTLRILSLPENILNSIETGEITAGHARALLSLKNKDQQKIAKDITTNKLSVRDTERIVKRSKPNANIKTVELVDLEEMLQKHLGTKVDITCNKQGGKIEITYYDNADLERIVDTLGLEIV